MGKKAARRPEEGGAESAEPGRPFDELVGDWIGKVVPERWLPVAFAGAALLALLLFILMIVGFARDPAEVAKGKIEKLGAQVETLEENLAKARDEKKIALREGGRSGHELERAEEKVARLEDQRKTLQAQMQELRKELDDLKVNRRELEAKLKAADQVAARDVQTVEKERNKAAHERDALSEQLEALKTELAQRKSEYDELRGRQEEATALYEKARAAYDSIVKTVGEIAEPEKKIEAIERLRAASHLDLEGTEYMARLDGMIERERGLIEKAERLAVKMAKREAKEAYEDYMNRLKMTNDYEAAKTLLDRAKQEFEELDDSAYLLKIDQEIKTRESAHADQIAREVHDEVMKAVASEPKAYEENLKRLEEALEKTKGSRWERAIQKQVDSRTATLPDDVAGALYEELVSRSRKNPDKHDENIAYAEEIKPKITKRYEKHFAKQLAVLKSARLESIGRKALSEAQEHVAKNAKDHSGNIEVLIELKKRAAGSRYEPKLAAMLERERKLLLRAEK